jgi:hypothetical protein
MREFKDATIALNVRLKPSGSSAHPRAANYTNVGVAQGTVCLDFRFIEPELLAAVAKTAKDGQAALKGWTAILSPAYAGRYGRYSIQDALRRGVAEDAMGATAVKLRSSTHVAMDVGGLARLQQNIQQVLMGLRSAKPGEQKRV